MLCVLHVPHFAGTGGLHALLTFISSPDSPSPILSPLYCCLWDLSSLSTSLLRVFTHTHLRAFPFTFACVPFLKHFLFHFTFFLELSLYSGWSGLNICYPPAHTPAPLPHPYPAPTTTTPPPPLPSPTPFWEHRRACARCLWPAGFVPGWEEEIPHRHDYTHEQTGCTPLCALPAFSSLACSCCLCWHVTVPISSPPPPPPPFCHPSPPPPFCPFDFLWEQGMADRHLRHGGLLVW